MSLFRNDYSEICHESILDALKKAATEQNIGYGLDKHSENAEKIIKEVFACPEANVHFLVGGTQTNMTMISYILKDYEAVIACKSGHINVHETGSIEGTGHKIYSVDGKNGKIYPQDVIDAVKCHCDEHMVKPALVYISNSTEIGSIYTKQELIDLYNTCKENGLYLFIDGARLACALTCKDNDLTPCDIAKYSDAFYIGGTKNGLMFGEALVIVNKELQKDFRYQIKNKGAMLAKGFIAGIQFETIFKDNIYFEIAKNANDCANLLANGLINLGIEVKPVYTNQIFVTVNNDLAKKIIDKFGCELWTDLNDKKVVRFVTSFATKMDDVEEAIKLIKEWI